LIRLTQGLITYQLL